MRKRLNQVDKFVASRIRLRRISLQMSQEKLGKALGVTFQQVQKYESAANRVGAGRLREISAALNVPVSYFYQGIETAMSGESELEDALFTALKCAMGRRLLGAFSTIKDGDLRHRIVELAEALANSKPSVQ